ncbi:hypothetical protein DER45DRAFT_601401 [Fusarium avenaceum]|nr:hypothetical protein DER45DRAFT_601401 [Fusarium avenaceum]
MASERSRNAHDAITMLTSPMDYLTGLRLMAEGAFLTNRGVDIITIHGIGGYDSWKYPTNGLSQDSEAVFWVRDFLPIDLPSARIFTYSYPSSALCDDQGINWTANKLLSKLKNLQADNPEILVSFANLPQHSLHWKIVHHYEELPLPDTDLRAVDPSQGEPWALPPVLLYKHHLDLCHFRNRQDLSYTKVLQSLRNITSRLSSSATADIAIHTTLSSAEEGREPLASPYLLLTVEIEVLGTLQTKDVYANIPDPSQGTCNWILELDAYKSWLETTSQQCLWIAGKPGSGKSTMMKYITEHQRLQNVPGQVVAHYFFHIGTNRSVTSLLSSLLHQLLKATPTTRTFEIFSRFIEKREYDGPDNTWDNDILMENLTELASKSTALGDSLFFYIDGLDECDDPDMAIAFLHRLSTSSPSRRIRICISSRSSDFSIPVVKIHMEDNNSSDIQTFLWKRLLALEDHLPPALDVEKTTQTLTEKAQGTFLWASLMASHLSSDSYLEACKTEKHFTPWLPTNLEAAYETILRRLWSWNDGVRRKATQDALTLVLCAQRDLSLPELQSALAATQTHWSVSSEIYDKQEKAPLNMTAQLMILGGGLLELKPWTPKSANDTSFTVNPTVHFIHSTVGRFLLERASYDPENVDCYFELTYSKEAHDSRELQLLESRRIKQRNAHYHLRVAWICLTYVNALGTSFHLLEDKIPTSSAPFLAYSLSFGMLHLSLADQMGVTPVTENMWQFPPFQKEFVAQWCSLHGQIFKDQMLFKPHKTKAVHIMSYYGFPWFDSGLWGSKLTDINDEDHYGHTPLSLAAAMGHLAICEILILEGADMSHREHIYGQTPLSLAVAHGHQSIVELLLRKGSDCDDHISGVTPLWLACRRSNLNIAKRLLEAGANPNATSKHTDESCLSRAATFGRVSVTRLLLEHGAKVDTYDKTGWTALHHAVSRGRKKTIEVLLSYLNLRQLRHLIVSFSIGRSKGSWVTAVLSAIILSICRQRGGESHTTSSCKRFTQRPIGTAGRRFSKKPTLTGHKRKLEGESDEEDCEENEEGTPGRKARRLDPNRRRFACPYHKRNESRFSSGECNKTGFTNMYRVKTHVKKSHDRATGWRRCQICQQRFQRDDFRDHASCERQERPTDYEDGYDQDQAEDLHTRVLRPSNSSEESCWKNLFRMLFPDWPENEDVPSPYHEDKLHLLSTHYGQAIQQHCDTIMAPSTISRILTCQSEDEVRLVLGQLVGDLGSNSGLTLTTTEPMPVVISQQLMADSQALGPLTFRPPLEEFSLAPPGNFNNGNRSTFSHSTDLISDANSSQHFQSFISTDMFTDGTAPSDQMSTNLDWPRPYNNEDSSGNLSQPQQQMPPPAPQPSTNNMNYNLGFAVPVVNQSINPANSLVYVTYGSRNPSSYTVERLEQSDPQRDEEENTRLAS